ncbi:hypothetical protein GDO81_022661 [Engystomops pustulosus]|uniref:Uncharacterized protein n=1 Tax=Engystomops pustulosus TaxID=76066 RepID=A0AAV6YT95_ENGPU|nr:hypothetical protein GDO81_022661 [Engystomops pustulosus]
MTKPTKSSCSPRKLKRCCPQLYFKATLHWLWNCGNSEKVLIELQYLWRSSCWTPHSSSKERPWRESIMSLNLPSFFQLYWWPQGGRYD